MRQTVADWHDSQVATYGTELFPCTPEGIAKAIERDGNIDPETGSRKRWEELVDWWPEDTEEDNNAIEERTAIGAVILAIAQNPDMFEPTTRKEAFIAAEKAGIVIPRSILPVIVPYGGTESMADVPVVVPTPRDPLAHGI